MAKKARVTKGAAKRAKTATRPTPGKTLRKSVRASIQALRLAEKPRLTKSPLSKTELEFFRKMLLEKRRSLIGDMNGMENEALRLNRQDAGGDLSLMPDHPANIATDNFEQEFTLGLLESERTLLTEINEALERIDANTYGICLGTGQPISKTRLTARPWAKFTIEYARMVEKGQVRAPEGRIEMPGEEPAEEEEPEEVEEELPENVEEESALADQPPKPGEGRKTGADAAPAPTRQEHVPPHRHAWRSPAAVTIFLAVIAGGAWADLASKDAVFRSFLNNPALPAVIERVREERIRPGKRALAKDVLFDPQTADLLQRQVAPGVKFTLSTNPGIVFGSQMIPRWAVNAATMLTIVLVVVFFATSDRAARLMHVALGCILGGAIGNLYDRMLCVVNLPGGLDPIRYEVRDFIDLHELYYKWVFNVADALLVIGVALIILGWAVATVKKPGAKAPAKPA